MAAAQTQRENKTSEAAGNGPVTTELNRTMKMLLAHAHRARALMTAPGNNTPAGGFPFESFFEMLDAVPASAVCNTVEAECRRLETDLQSKRLTLNDELVSILIFNRFLKAVIHGFRLTPSVVSDAAVRAYRKTVDRLIQADLLPLRAQEEFERTFLSSVVR